MTLDDYLSRPGNTVAALAEKAGTSTVTIWRLLHGEQKPSVEMIKAIVGATNGSVTADDLVFGETRPKGGKPEQDAAA